LPLLLCSLDEKKAQAVVDEVTEAGGDALAVGGDVGADDFPEKVIGATIKYVARLTRSYGS
jgi:3-oxoacyl-[acyl-carrier protein] reductase